MKSSRWILSLALSLALLGSMSLSAKPVGGGILDSGLVGHYFNNASFSGSPTFTRRDIRLDYDWGTVLTPGGGIPGSRLSQIGTDHYTVRWEGQIVSRFSETYTITVFGDSARVWLKPATQANYPGTAQINHWPASDSATYVAQSTTLAMTAGVAYDIRVEYRERTGPAMLRLLWSSPSTPQEVIQPTAFVAEQPPSRGVLLADSIVSATNWGDKDNLADGDLARDAQGWPAEDFTFVIRPIDQTLNPGTYLISFQGTARVEMRLYDGEEFSSADGTVSYGALLDPGEGYDSGTNTTTARVHMDPEEFRSAWPDFTQTDRDGPGTAHGLNTGVTNLRLMRPTTLNSTEPHGLDEVFARDALAAMERFVTFRWNDVNGDEGDQNWSERMNYFGQGGTSNENHEYKVQWCNHVGRDLWIQVPHRASDDYITKMAQLLRYGSDVNGTPYTAPTANPAYPPLNPNLRIYLEYSNEAPWNTAGQYKQGNWMRAEPERLRQAWLANPASSDGQRYAILNYDGFLGTASDVTGLDAGKRFFALRSVEMSNLFRAVFGDAAMPAPGKLDPRVRPVINYQYDNNNNTARDALFFIDNYWNKTDPASTFAGTARPMPHFFYGGGPATYYASDDRLGIVPDLPFNTSQAGTFQSPAVPVGQALLRPSGSPWTFAGNAGIYHQAARTEATLGTLGSTTTSVDDHDYRGFKFTVGASDIAVYEMARHFASGNAAVTYTLAIYDAATNELQERAVSVPVESSRGVGFQYTRTGTLIFVASKKFFSHPIILKAGRSYYFVCQETNGGNAHATAATLTPPAGLSIQGTVRGRDNGDGTWSWIEGATANRTYGPINFRFATVPIRTTDNSLTLGFLNDSKEDRDEQMRSNLPEDYSTQALFIAGTGSASIPVTFNRPGTYGLIYHLAYRRDQDPAVNSDGKGTANDDHTENPPRLFLSDGTTEIDITPSDQNDIRPPVGAGGWSHEGYWVKPKTGFDFFGSAPFVINNPGITYTLRIEADDVDPTEVVLFDNIVIADTATMLAGTIPAGGGLAEGAPDVSNWEARVMNMYVYVQTFGLHATAYEGGWYPGGDANKMPLQYAASYFDPLIRQGEINAMEAVGRAGLVVNCDYSRDFALPDYDFANSDSYQRMQAWDVMHAKLSPEATNGLPIASTLSETSRWWSHRETAGTLEDGGWMSWNLIAPETASYIVRVDTTAGGAYELVKDEHLVIVEGTSGGLRTSATGVTFTKGLHSVRVKATSGTFRVNGVAIAKAGQAFGFSGLEAQAGEASAFLLWPPQSGVDGYHVYYRERLDLQWTRANTGLLPPGVAGTYYVVGGLTNGVTHKFVVTRVSGGVESAYSNEVAVVPTEGAYLSLLAWDFTDATNKATAGIPNTFQTALAEPSAVTAGPGLMVSNNSAYNKDAVPVSRVSSSALDPVDYLSWKVRPTVGTGLSLKRLEFGLWHNSSTGMRAELRLSTDGFASHVVLPLSPAPSSIAGTNGSYGTGTRISVPLGSYASVQDLTHDTTVEFRLYLWGLFNEYKLAGLGALAPGGVGPSLLIEGSVVPTEIPLEITSQPVSQAVLEGQNATFAVAAAGDGALAYQWRKNGNPVPGATAAVFTIVGAIASDAGSYDVVVTDNNTSVTSAAAVLTVDRVPRITTVSLPQATAGQPYAHAMQAVSGDGNLTWSLVNAPAWLSIGPSSGMLSGTPTAAGTANFTAEVRDADLDADTEPFSLTIAAPPSVVTLWEWDFTDATNKTTAGLGSTYTAPNVIAGQVALGASANYSANTNGNYDAVPVSGVETAALDPAAYLAWAVAAAPGRSLWLDELVFGLWHSDNGGTQRMQAELRVSTNGFATYTVLPLTPAPNTLARTNMNYATATEMVVDLAAVPTLQGTAGAEFRLYLWGLSSAYKLAGIGKLEAGGVGPGLLLTGYAR